MSENVRGDSVKAALPNRVAIYFEFRALRSGFRSSRLGGCNSPLELRNWFVFHSMNWDALVLLVIFGAGC
jgi:hypothetical protein